jgi:hypothetical protein
LNVGQGRGMWCEGAVARSAMRDKAWVIGLTMMMGQVLDIVAECFCNFRRTIWITMLD